MAPTTSWSTIPSTWPSVLGRGPCGTQAISSPPMKVERATTERHGSLKMICLFAAQVQLTAVLPVESPGTYFPAYLAGTAGGGSSRRAENEMLGPAALEMRPEKLVRDLVVELHFRGLDEGAEGLGAAFGLGHLDLGELGVHLFPHRLLHEPAPLEQPDGVVDVVRQEAGARSLVPVLLGLGTFEPGLEQGVDRHVRIGVGSDGAHLDARRALVAEGDAHHGAAVDGRGLDLVGRLEVGVEAAVRVDAGVEHQAEVRGTGQ